MSRPHFDANSAVGFCNTCPGAPPSDCRSERREIARKCGVSRRESNNAFESRQNYNRRRVRPGRTRRTVQARHMTWKDKHCGPVLLQMNASNIRERMRDLNDMADNLFQDIEDYASDLGVRIAQDKMERYMAASGGRYVASALCGPAVKVCAAAMTVVNAVSGVWSIFSGALSFRRARAEINQTVERLTNIRNNANAILDAADNPGELDHIQREVSDQMARLAAADPCLRARKCFMVPYNPPSQRNPQGPASMNQSGRGRAGLFDTGPLDLSDSRGCCPGQTGHHLLPGAMLDHCSSYTNSMHNQAPTVCVEGANQSMGSHGRVHAATDDLLRQRFGNGGPMTMEDAVDLSTEAYFESRVGNQCNRDCIKQQLRDFYNRLGCQPRPIGSRGQMPGGDVDDGDI